MKDEGVMGVEQDWGLNEGVYYVEQDWGLDPE